MTPQQIIKAIRDLQDRVAALEAVKIEPPVKRAYQRKTPNAEMAPESVCQNSPTTS
jgi:hypothetical protein